MLFTRDTVQQGCWHITCSNELHRTHTDIVREAKAWYTSKQRTLVCCASAMREVKSHQTSVQTPDPHRHNEGVQQLKRAMPLVWIWQSRNSWDHVTLATCSLTVIDEKRVSNMVVILWVPSFVRYFITNTEVALFPGRAPLRFLDRI